MVLVAGDPKQKSKNGWSRALRLSTFRQLVPPTRRASTGLIVKIAETDEERAAAFRLLHDEYVRAGLAVRNESGMRITPYHRLPTTRVVIAIEEGEVVGTLSLIQRSAKGVPAESLFDLSSLCATGALLEEVSSLTVKGSLRDAGTHGDVMFRLFRFAIHDSVDRGVALWVATFHPRHRYLYEELLGFELFEARRVESYEFVNGAPAMGASVVVKDFRRILAALYGEHTPHTPLTFLSAREEPPGNQVAVAPVVASA